MQKNFVLKPIAIYGAGGQGREVLQLIRQINRIQPQWNCIGWFDDGLKKGSTIAGLPVLGGVDQLNKWPQALAVAVAIAQPEVKQPVVERIHNGQLYFPPLVHPSVEVEECFVKIGAGTLITQGCRLTVDIEIGKFVLLNIGTILTHDVVIEDYCSLMPSVNVSGAVRIGTGAYIGTGTQIIQLLHIGARTIVGAGSVVIDHLPADCTAVGVPAKPIKFHAVVRK